MLMKYKDFKILSQNEMKMVLGGNAVDCNASITCGDGHTYTCAGNTGTWSGGGSLGCAGQDNAGATCYYLEAPNSWAFAQITCHGSGSATTSWGTMAQ
jgi:hypothetical protein